MHTRKWSSRQTVKELYQCNRLPFGIASAPAIFQKAMDSILQGIPYVLCFLDDILIAGPTVEEHFKSCEEVLRRLQNHGLHLKEGKCVFLEESVEFLGHCIDASGVSTSAKKVEAVQKTPAPRNVQELCSFLGLVHYYGKFIPNLSSLLQPLNQLLLKDQQWRWTAESQRAFELVKGCLTKAPVLAHYNSALPLRLAGDASPYGLGAIISHVYPDGSERPIAYASRTLSSSERNYVQVEKEALSLIFGLKRFHQYLYGCEFQILTDHKPLISILGSKSGVPPLAAA